MKLAIFGLGSIGSRHARNLYEMGERDVLGCDSRVGQEGFLPDVRCQSTNIASMVWGWKPEAVLICTPPETHTDLADAAINFGAHCFSEKPLATGETDCRHLAYQAKRKKIHLAIGYQLRFAMADFYKHAAGHDVQFHCSQDMRTWPSQYQKDVLLEFSHEIDAAVHLNGPVETVVARRYGHAWSISLRHQLRISSILINPESSTALRFAHSEMGYAWEFDHAKNDQAYKDELATFIKVCRGETWDNRLCSGVEAAHVVRVVEACKESANECRVARL